MIQAGTFNASAIFSMEDSRGAVVVLCKVCRVICSRFASSANDRPRALHSILVLLFISITGAKVVFLYYACKGCRDFFRLPESAGVLVSGSSGGYLEKFTFLSKKSYFFLAYVNYYNYICNGIRLEPFKLFCFMSDFVILLNLAAGVLLGLAFLGFIAYDIITDLKK